METSLPNYGEMGRLIDEQLSKSKSVEDALVEYLMALKPTIGAESVSKREEAELGRFCLSAACFYLRDTHEQPVPCAIQDRIMVETFGREGQRVVSQQRLDAALHRQRPRRLKSD